MTSVARIAVILPKLTGGGIERGRLRLIDAFMARGLDVDLVLGRNEGELCGQIPEGVSVFEIAKGGRVWFFFGLLRYLRERRPTHILSAFEDVSCMVIIANCFLPTKSRVLISNHSNYSGLNFARSELKWSDVIKQRIIFFLMKRVYRRADAIVAVSSGISDQLIKDLKLPCGSIDLIYDPVISSDFNALALEPASEYFSESRDVPQIIYVGRLSKEKRLDYLIRAFLLLRKNYAAHLLIIGEGSERAALDKLINKLGLNSFVKMPGFVSNPLPIIRNSKMLVLPSAHEGLGNVLVEAMACGTQVVSTDCPFGPAEILENGRWGQLVPVDSENDLCEAMRRALTEEFWVRPEELSARALNFSVDLAAERYLSVLEVG